MLRLTKNLRLNRMDPGVDFEETKGFTNWIAAIGDGTLSGPNDGFGEVVIPPEILLFSSGDQLQLLRVHFLCSVVVIVIIVIFIARLFWH